MKFRKRPIIVDAEQWYGGWQIPDGVCCKPECCMNGPHVHTLEGVMRVEKMDWVIRGVKGEYYPCKPDIFNATYESLNE